MAHKQKNGSAVRARNLAKTFLFASLLFQSGVSAQERTSVEKPAADSLIHIDITGLRNDKGKVVCALYRSADGFPKKPDKAIAHTSSEILDHHAVCQFSAIWPGTYAVSVFHDENSNGKLDANFMGIPREGVGASNNARGHLGPPKFDAAAFQFLGSRLDLKIKIAYL